MKRILLLLFVLIISKCIVAQTPKLETDLALKYIISKSASLSSPVVIFLHGYGSDEKDLYELKSFLPSHYSVISVQAPLSMQGGGYKWYDIPNTDDKNYKTLLNAQLKASRDKLSLFISQIQKKYKMSGAVYLVGFSQGAVMSYEEAIYNSAQIKGIAALSGRCYPSLNPSSVNKIAAAKVKYFIGHGKNDNRIPFSDAIVAEQFLKTMGAQVVTSYEDSMGHQINDKEMNALAKWLVN